MVSIRWISALGLLIAAGWPAAGHAQDTTAGQAPPPAAVTVTWHDGVTIQTEHGDNLLQFGGLVQLDGRFDPDDPTSTVSETFVLRRVRLTLQGRVQKYFEFRIMPDFGNGTVVLFDAYFDTKLSNSFRIRAGKDKTPIGLEQLYSDYALLFPERTLVTNLVPNRDVGVQAIGQVHGGFLSYDGAIFNGARDGENADIDTNGGKDLVGRVQIRPFLHHEITLLEGFGVAIGGSSGRDSGALPSYKSTAQQTFFTYTSSAVANGDRTRVSPAAFYYYKSIGAFAEYARTTQAVSRTTSTAAVAVSHSAWEVTGSVVLSGERATDKGVTPARPFDPSKHQWGAVQLVARHSRLTIDPAAFSEGLASASASGSAEATGVSTVWYANANVKYVLSFERTVFDHDPKGRRAPEHALIFRLQFNVQPSL